jgi:hypothetical protein
VTLDISPDWLLQLAADEDTYSGVTSVGGLVVRIRQEEARDRLILALAERVCDQSEPLARAAERPRG